MYKLFLITDGKKTRLAADQHFTKRQQARNWWKAHSEEYKNAITENRCVTVLRHPDGTSEQL